MNRQLLILPAIIFGMVAVFAFRGLSIDGTSMPSAMLGKPAPQVKLEPLPRYNGPFDPSQLTGEVTLVNVWGSWCTYCTYEHPFLMELKERGVVIYGLDWNDTPEAGAAWLDRYGSPFEAVGLDQTGRAVAEFGVTGAPETFVIDKAGIIRHRHVGVLTEREWRREIEPLVRKLETESSDKDLGA